MTKNSFDSSDLMANITREMIRENRSAKRWKNIRFFIVLFIFVAAIALIFSMNGVVSLDGTTKDRGYVSLIRLEGMIEAGRDFSAEEVLPRLRDAFSDPHAKGVVFVINSGGGTPVQASIIHDAILDLKKKYHKKVVVVGEDLMASGAYYVAVSADKIYVNPNTITGSIGVIMKGFGFPEVLKKTGVERRVYASGVDKDRLDPFLPTNPQDVEKIRAVIGEIHNNFNQVVLKGRAGKLKGTPEQLFNGDFWPGEKALSLGLVDGLGNLTNVVHDEFQVSRYRNYSITQSPMKSFMNQLGMTVSTIMNGADVQVLEKI